MKNKLSIEILLSTMNQKNVDFLSNVNIKGKATVVNQNGGKKFHSNRNLPDNINWINSPTKGLSRSRNIALQNSSSDIVIIADDDVTYVDNYEDIILDAYNKHPDADIIAFQFKGKNDSFKKYSKQNKVKNINFLTSMKLASVEITMKRESILAAKLKFDENFGSGSKHKMGEENIFLFDSLRKGLKIIQVPVVIGYVKIGESSWFHGYTEDYFKDLGAVYYRMSPFYSCFLIFQFILRKRKIYKSNINMLNAIKYALIGRNSQK